MKGSYRSTDEGVIQMSIIIHIKTVHHSFFSINPAFCSSLIQILIYFYVHFSLCMCVLRVGLSFRVYMFFEFSHFFFF